MIADSNAPWKALFTAPATPENGVCFRFRLVRRHGHPLLLVPTRRAAIRESLELYPAQTGKARLARRLLGYSLGMGMPWGTEEVELRVEPAAEFVRFLLPGGGAGPPQSFALFCGNPAVPGRRFILLVFDPKGHARHVVKAGIGEEGARLIQAEAAFLKSHSTDVLSAPAVTGEFIGGGIAALAMTYVAGKHPSPQAETALSELLTAWLHMGQVARLADLPAWQRLIACSRARAGLCRLGSELADARFHPAVYHGDLAPWNIRVDPATRKWRVLDWERGETAGPPGWDWFHFVIQDAALVRRATAQRLADRMDSVLQSPPFQRYAAAAGIAGCARQLLHAYVLYWRDVLRPAEGVERIETLLSLLTGR